MPEKDDERTEIEEHEDLDAEQIIEDAGELFGAEDHSPPIAESETPPTG